MMITVKPVRIAYTAHHVFERNGGWGERNAQLDLVFEIDGRERTACMSRYLGYMSEAQRDALMRHLPAQVRVRTRRRAARLRPYLPEMLYTIERADLDAWRECAFPSTPVSIGAAIAMGWTISRESGRQVILVKDRRSITRYR